MITRSNKTISGGQMCESGIHRRKEPNVGAAERVVSACAGARLLTYGLRRGGLMRWLGAAAGGALMWHAMKRHCRLYRSLGITGDDASPVSTPLSRHIRSRSSVTIDAPADQLYQHWREVSHLERLFPHVTHIERLDDQRSRWTMRLTDNREVSWEAILTEQRENERLAWRTEDHAALDSRGCIAFASAPGGRGTLVTLEIRSHLPGGAVGALLARIMGRDPSWEATEALRRFKQWIETGEIASARSPAHRDEGWTGHSLRESVSDGMRETSLTNESKGSGSSEAVEEASRESFPASDPPAFNA